MSYPCRGRAYTCVRAYVRVEKFPVCVFLPSRSGKASVQQQVGKKSTCLVETRPSFLFAQGMIKCILVKLHKE